MRRDYLSLEVLCKREYKGEEEKLVCQNGEYSTVIYSDRTFMANEGPLARCEELGVNLLDCEDIDSLELPSDIKEFSLSLARKVVFESAQCKVVSTLSRKPIVRVSKDNMINFNSEGEKSLIETLKELAKATKERTIKTASEEPELKLSFR